jgi:uncharacterized membrane protein
MAAQRTTSERLAAFSDGVFAVIITIMVLDLRPPTRGDQQMRTLDGFMAMDGQGLGEKK